jgi:hypothetical protein
MFYISIYVDIKLNLRAQGKMKIDFNNKTLKDSRRGDIAGGSCGRERSFGVFLFKVRAL